MFKYEAEEIIKGLSHPGKMPCPSYGLDPHTCGTSGQIKCPFCYVAPLMKIYPGLAASFERHRLAISDPRWCDAFVRLLRDEPFFRWHWSGDVLDSDHLGKIFEIADRSDRTSFWLPTKKYSMFRNLHPTAVPKNLTVRISAPSIDVPPPKTVFVTSTINYNLDPIGYVCPAVKTHGHCGDCRACWEKTTANVSYPAHSLPKAIKAQLDAIHKTRKAI